MSGCCCPSQSFEGTDRFFSRQSRRFLKRFRKRGLAKEQRYLAEGFTRLPLGGKSILEIGCGVGGLHVTLLKEGAGLATGVDISEGMLEGAKQLSREMGFENRTTYLLGDFVQMDGKIADADITILDKVVCCYEDIDTLVQKSLEKTRMTYALSFPRNTWLIGMFFNGLIFLSKILKWKFRPYWHDWDEMLQRIQSAGFQRAYEKKTLVWSVLIHQRPQIPSTQ